MIKIESFKLADLDSIEYLVDEFVSSHKEFFFKPNYRAAFRDWIQTINSNPEVIILVAKEGEKAVGIAIGIITENGPLILPDKIGYIPMFVVSAQFRRKKLAISYGQTCKIGLLIMELKKSSSTL